MPVRAVLALLAGMALGASAQGRAAPDPLGVWHCASHGQGGEQRFYLMLASDGRARIAGVAEALRGRWAALGDWRRARGELRFDDPGSGRTFDADLALASLGGTWSAEAGRGRWWCASVAPRGGARPPPAARLMVDLVPAIMASPNYPLQAIREAKEGRAVSCFFVFANGETGEPELLELTDEIFREPTLRAVARSRYRGPDVDGDAPLPACRSFTFELQPAG